MSRAAERLNGLRWRLAATRRLWSAGARPEMPFIEPVEPRPQPMGKLELPWSKAVQGRAFDLGGWVLFPSGPTARVELSLGGRPLGRARLGFPRYDVRAISDLPHSLPTGFQLRASMDEWGGPEGEAELLAVATSLAGERYQLPPETVTVIAEEPPEREVPAPPARTSLPGPPPPGRPRVLVITHQLNLGGAQLYLLDLLREMVASERAGFTVVSALDGELRADLEALGIPVHISGVVPWDDLGGHVGVIEEMVAWAAGREFDVALVNTATALTFSGAEAAQQLGLPVVWAIHESYDTAVLLTDFEHRIRARGLATLGDARLVFEADATRRLFEPVAGEERCLTLPYGLDLEPIDSERRGFDRAAARAEAGIPADAELLVCVGTIEPRKAQLLLTQAFELVGPRHPRARLALVGSKGDVESLTLRDYIALSPLADRIDLIDVTPDVGRWYGIADFFVCASDVESLPRTVLEAMAWEKPVLATDVFGLPELIVDGESGWLCEARDFSKLTAALDRVLSSSPEERRRIGRAGRELVEQRHSLPRYAEQIEALLDEEIGRSAERG